MGAASLPFNINNGDPLDATQVMANDQAITAVVNGGLEANSNISTDSAVTQPGSANGEGTAATLARSDHLHLIQGFENLAADPITGNFRGRTYWNTATSTLRYCSDATGTGTFQDVTPTAGSLVVHAAQHKDGGHDPIADNTLTDHMFAARGQIFSQTLGSDSPLFSGTAWTNIVDLPTVVTTNSQTLGVSVATILTNTDGSGGSDYNAGLRVVDVTNANTTLWRSGNAQIVKNSVQTLVNGFFFTNTPSAGGTRTLRVQGSCTIGSKVKAVAPAGFNTESLTGPTISAVIL